MSKDNDGVINFFEAKQKTLEKGAASIEQEELENVEMINQGVTAFNDAIEQGGIGFISVVFDDSPVPSIVVAGEIDPYRALGILEFCKQEIMNNLIYGEEAILSMDGFDDED